MRKSAQNIFYTSDYAPKIIAKKQNENINTSRLYDDRIFIISVIFFLLVSVDIIHVVGAHYISNQYLLEESYTGKRREKHAVSCFQIILLFVVICFMIELVIFNLFDYELSKFKETSCFQDI